MSGNFLGALVEFCKANFNFDPVNYAELSDTLYVSSQNEEAFINLEFPNDELADIFNYETLSLLLKTDKDFRDNHKEIVKNILIVINNFYSGNKNAVDYLDIYYSLPLKNYCENIEKCVNNIENANHFLLFNFLLNNINNIQEQYYDNIEFIILNILLLYDYAFIRNKLANINSKYAISLIIITLMGVYIKASDNYSMASKLANFFFEGGQINYKSFLVPENLYENGYKEFDELILIVKKIFEDESISKDIIMKIEVLNKLQRIKLFKEENKEKTEINKKNNIEKLNKNNNKEEPNIINNNDKKEPFNIINNEEELNINNNNEELNISNNNKGEFNKTNKENNNNITREFCLKKEDKAVEELEKLYEKEVKELKEISKLNFKELNKLNEEIAELKESDKKQNEMIDYLYNIMANKAITKVKVKNIKEDLLTANKDLEQNSITLKEIEIKIDNLIMIEEKMNQDIIKLSNNMDSLNKRVEELKNDNKNIHNRIDLIDNHDFFRKIFSDFCHIFGFINNGQYEEIAKQIINKIKNGNIDSSIKQFTQKVNLIEFIDFLPKIIKESDNINHYFIPELSMQFRNSDINELTNKENIKENMNKCRIAFNQYCKMNFDSVFSFLINDCDYPNLIINKLNINNSGFQQAIDNYNNTK